MNSTTPMTSSLIDGKEVLLNGISVAYNSYSVLYINSVIDRSYAAEISALILSAKRPLVLSINSSGGEVFSALSICNAISIAQNRGYEITTLCDGSAYSAAALILAAGTPGKRYCIPDGDVMIHQCISSGGGISGKSSDVITEAEHTKYTNERLCEKLAQLTGKTFEEIKRDTELNFYMTPELAKNYGIIDHIGTPEHFYK